jgi:hypothetical protein
MLRSTGTCDEVTISLLCRAGSNHFITHTSHKNIFIFTLNGGSRKPRGLLYSIFTVSIKTEVAAGFGFGVVELYTITFICHVQGTYYYSG